MFDPIRRWWRESREWRRTHDQTFAEVAVADADGITAFQRRIMSAVEPTIRSDSFMRAVMSDGTPYLVANIPGTSSQLFVYPREAGISTKDACRGEKWTPYEEWDFRTPDELISAVVSDLRKEHAI